MSAEAWLILRAVGDPDHARPARWRSRRSRAWPASPPRSSRANRRARSVEPRRRGRRRCRRRRRAAGAGPPHARPVLGGCRTRDLSARGRTPPQSHAPDRVAAGRPRTRCCSIAAVCIRRGDSPLTRIAGLPSPSACCVRRPAPATSALFVLLPIRRSDARLAADRVAVRPGGRDRRTTANGVDGWRDPPRATPVTAIGGGTVVSPALLDDAAGTDAGDAATFRPGPTGRSAVCSAPRCRRRGSGALRCAPRCRQRR